MGFPSPDAYREQHGRGLEIQTDKEKFKIVPCTYAGCDIDLIVNTFYAPAKGKCSRHNGSGAKAISSSHLTHVAPNTDAAPNGALAKMLCPLCEMPMLIVSITDDGGRITFRCAEGLASRVHDLATAKRCGTSVQIRINNASVELRYHPTRFKEAIDTFNLDQSIAYFDLKEDREG